MKKFAEGAPVVFHWPDNPANIPPPEPGRFHDTGEYPDTYQKFFDRYGGGVVRVLPGTAQAGATAGVRAQVGLEGHGEQGVDIALQRAAADPGNPWGLTPDDVSQHAAWRLFVLDFMAVEGKQGCLDVMAKYPHPPAAGRGRSTTPPTPATPTVPAEETKARAALASLKTAGAALRKKLPERGGAPIQKLAKEVSAFLDQVDRAS